MPESTCLQSQKRLPLPFSRSNSLQLSKSIHYPFANLHEPDRTQTIFGPDQFIDIEATEAVHDVHVPTNQSHGTAITIPVAVTGIDADEVVALRVLDTLHRQILSEVRLEEILYGLQVLKFAHGVLVLSG